MMRKMIKENCETVTEQSYTTFLEDFSHLHERRPQAKCSDERFATEYVKQSVTDWLVEKRLIATITYTLFFISTAIFLPRLRCC